MASLFKQPKVPSYSMPTPTVPQVPVDESADEAQKLLKRRMGRMTTILTGDLEPMDIGKKQLLG
jgi:hypothetical protein